MPSFTPQIHIPKRVVEKTRFANGTTLLYASNPYNQIVAIRIMSRYASRHEIGEKAGLANLSLRLLSSGTRFHTEDQIADLLEQNGAHYKAESGKDISSIDLLTTTHFVRDDLRTVLELIDAPIFPEDKLKREREIVKMNILEQEDSKLNLTIRNFRKRYYGNHPYSWPSIGLIDTLDSIQRNDLAEFSHTAFDPSNLVVSVVGGSEDSDIKAIVSEAFANRDPRQDIQLIQSEPARSVIHQNHEIVETRETESEYLVMGFPGCGVKDREAVVIRVTAALLGGSMDSRLFREIRDKRGLCYQVGSNFSPQLDHTPLLVYVVTSPKNRADAVSCTEAEIERLKNEPVTVEELDRVKTYVCGNYVMSLESNMGQASCYGNYEIHGLGWEYANQLPDDINAVTVDQIMETARERFTHRLLAITAPPAKQ